MTPSVLSGTQLNLIPLCQYLRNSFEDVPVHVTSFIVNLHDWLAHIAQERAIWHDYDWSIYQEFGVKFESYPKDIQEWVQYIQNHDPSIKSLVYRHYLSDKALSHDLVLEISERTCPLLLSCLMVPHPQFSSIEFKPFIERVSQDQYPINTLRKIWPLFHKVQYNLSVTDTVDPSLLMEEHACLSSLILLAGLVLSYVLIDHEAKLNQSKTLHECAAVIQDTVTHLEGVLCHGTLKWQ